MLLLNLLWVLTGLFAAALFYASVPHQKLLPTWQRRSALRAAACMVYAISLALAIYTVGPWSGIFGSLTALMLGCVVLPYVNAWQLQGESADVG